jgi:hypothetical protein
MKTFAERFEEEFERFCKTCFEGEPEGEFKDQLQIAFYIGALVSDTFSIKCVKLKKGGEEQYRSMWRHITDKVQYLAKSEVERRSNEPCDILNLDEQQAKYEEN